MADTLTPTLRLVDLLDPALEAQVDPQVIAQTEAALAQTGRSVDRSVLIALAHQQQALDRQALAVVAPQAVPRARKGWRLGTRWRWWYRAWRRTGAVRMARIQAHVANAKAKLTPARTWRSRLDTRQATACGHRQADVVSPLAIAYHGVRRARQDGLREATTTWGELKALWRMVTQTTDAQKNVPLSEAHWHRLAQAFRAEPTGHCWAPCYFYDDPRQAFAHRPLLLESVTDHLEGFFKPHASKQGRDPGNDDLALFDALLKMGADPDVAFRDSFQSHFGLPTRSPDWRVLSPREVLLLACQRDLLDRLPTIVHTPHDPLDSWLWWVTRARQVQPDPLFTELLRDEPDRILDAVNSTLHWVLTQEDAPHLQRRPLQEAVEAETHPDLRALFTMHWKRLGGVS